MFDDWYLLKSFAFKEKKTSLAILLISTQWMKIKIFVKTSCTYLENLDVTDSLCLHSLHFNAVKTSYPFAKKCRN